jgi:hypothetical protein
MCTQNFLNILVDIRSNIVGPWILIGDFNLVREANEKNNDESSALQHVYDIVHELGLVELPSLDCLY